MANPKYSKYYTYIEPVTQNQVVRSYAPYIFSLIFIIVFGLFAIKPAIGKISDLRKEVADKSQLLDRLEKKNQDIDLAKQHLDQIPDDKKAKIGLALPDSPEVTSLVSALQATTPKQASLSALQIQSVMLFDSKNKSVGFTEGNINFVFNNSGAYTDLITELQSLNNLPRIIKIDNLTISKGDLTGLNLSVNGNAFYKK